MAIVVPNEAEINLLEFLVGQSAEGLDGCRVRLYTNNLTPGATTVLGDFTEATWTGYSEADPAPWGTVATDGMGRAATTSATMVYSNSSGGSQTFFGYYVTDSADTKLLFCERIGSTSIPNGGSRALIITFQLAQG